MSEDYEKEAAKWERRLTIVLLTIGTVKAILLIIIIYILERALLG